MWESEKGVWEGEDNWDGTVQRKLVPNKFRVSQLLCQSLVNVNSTRSTRIDVLHRASNSCWSSFFSVSCNHAVPVGTQWRWPA